MTQLVTGCCCCLKDKTFWKSWVEESVDTVGNGVLMLLGGQYFFGNLGWRRVLTQLVTGNGVLLLFGRQDIWKSWVEEGVDTVGNGVLLLFGGQDLFGNLGWRRVLTQLVTGNGVLLLIKGQDFLEILGGGGC